MAFENLPKGSILYIEAKDPLAIDTGTTTNNFSFGGATLSAPGQRYTSSVASRNKLSYSDINNMKFRRVSEHNRSEFSISPIRIEQQTRMANGYMRKYFTAEKKQFSLSWDMLPSYRNETVDGAWGAEDLKYFYESSAGRGSFRIRINPTVLTPATYLEDSSSQLLDDYTYTVVFTSCNFTVAKRGIQPYWNVSMTLEEV